MRRSFALRLAAAFAGVGIAAAALTAILVNVAFGSQFSGYPDAQQRAREQQLVAALADSYRKANGWNTSDLQSLARSRSWTVAPCGSWTPQDGPCGPPPRPRSASRRPRCTVR